MYHDDIRCGVSRASMKGNCLLIKPELGKVKKTTTQLPRDDFVFGMKSFGDCEGARDVTMVWQEHVPNPDVKPGPDYVAMNKLAAIQGLTNTRSLRDFRMQNPLTIKRRSVSPRGSSVALRLQHQIFGMESSYRSAEKIRNYGAEEPYIQHVIQGAFQDVWIRDNIKKKKKADERTTRLFEASPTRASIGHTKGASLRIKSDTSAVKDAFKLKKFLKVQSKLQGLNQTRKVAEVES